jgi:hypothetical protein
MTTEDTILTGNLPAPQKALFCLMYFNNATLRHSDYFYGFEMKIPGFYQSRYFRGDTVNAMLKKELIIKDGNFYQLSGRFALR